MRSSFLNLKGSGFGFGDFALRAFFVVDRAARLVVALVRFELVLRERPEAFLGTAVVDVVKGLLLCEGDAKRFVGMREVALRQVVRVDAKHTAPEIDQV